MSLIIESSPRDQLFMGAFLLLAGVVLLPAMASVMMPFAKWMNEGVADMAWWQTTWDSTKLLIAFSCTMIALLGLARLMVYSLVKAGLIGSPWT